jgi:hypothetical protein|nr:zinc-ribbon domain-containing protein [Candidatus Krumholzibacteria bacterium]
MFFIFGWGVPRVTDHGPAETRQCPHCHNERPWHLQENSSWITLFFLPVWRTSHSFSIVCPICNFGYELTDGDLERYFPGQ